MAIAAAAPPGPGYRPEIDGLRALAIVPVVLFHAGVPGFGGGYVGVDVFFVISGYLITGILMREAGGSGIDFGRFYEHRVRRIVPALLPALAVSLLASWWVMTPDDFYVYGEALAASALFASSLWFARQTSYFYSDDGAAPLLHTWSLSVEEQFYLLYPTLFAWVWRRFPAALPWLAAAGCIGALGAALLLRHVNQFWSFYLLPARSWELLAGAACALVQARLPKSPALAQPAALAGLVAIVAGLALIKPQAAVPEPLFLLPVLGTAAVLAWGDSATLAGRMLGWRPLTIVGLASYGFYLWHVPLLAALKYQWFGPPPPALVAAAIGAAFALALLSWRLIETPVRTRRMLRSRRRLALVCGGALLLVAVAGAAIWQRVLVPRSAAQSERLGAVNAGLATSEIVLPAGPLPYLVYGDSHARQYFPALAQRIGGGGLLSASGCMTLPHLGNLSENPDRTDCPQRFARLMKELAAHPVPVLVWAQRWQRELSDARTGRVVGTAGVGPGAELLRRELAAARTAIPATTRLVLVGNSPTAWAAGPQLQFGLLRCRSYRDAACPSSYPETLAEGREANAVLRSFAARTPGVTYVDAAAFVCSGGRCPIIANGRLNYSDGSHFTPLAAAKVAGAIANAIRQPQPRGKLTHRSRPPLR
ncbi:acyltransferase family protein [Parablastomonas sp. CN1-191]|uniref:acyltransferase family protein n=1 Tax=Parablastomonas sp. CN1-191 TaxID=3400908 RepID=UPI003BF8BC0A